VTALNFVAHMCSLLTNSGVQKGHGHGRVSSGKLRWHCDRSTVMAIVTVMAAITVMVL